MIVWTDQLSVGIPRIDHQHRRLVEILNEFEVAHRAGHGRDVVFTALNALVKYTEFHFRDEEQLWVQNHLHEAEEHLAQHEWLVERIFELQTRHEQGDVVIDDYVLEFLTDWLRDHILGHDRRAAEHVLERRIPAYWERVD